jgi:hypothetical protein
MRLTLPPLSRQRFALPTKEATRQKPTQGELSRDFFARSLRVIGKRPHREKRRHSGERLRLADRQANVEYVAIHFVFPDQA